MENQQNNLYNPPPQGPMMPPTPNQSGQTPLERRRMMAQNDVRNAANGIMSFPKWLSQYSIIVYLLALAVVSFMYSAYSMPWYYMLSGVVTVSVFYLYASTLVKGISVVRLHSNRQFEKRIFLIAFIPRFLWMLLIYFIFMQNYGDAFGFDNGDAMEYDGLGRFVASLIGNGNFHFINELSQYTGRHGDISDMGYGIYLGFIYWMTDNNIIVVRMLKCLWSSLTVVLLYRLASRNFGDQTARIAAIFCALWPNFWYYCGCHLKEVEMVFLTVLCIEQVDLMLRSRQFTAWRIIPVVLIIGVLFSLRTVLALTAILSILFAMVMSSTKVVSWGKRIIVGVLSVLMIWVTMGSRIEEQSRELIESVQGGYQKGNMEWRATRKDASGNQQKFAKYAGAAIFAPMIFTLPFPTMVRPFDGQNVQQLLNGGNFVKNIMSFFTVFALIMLLLSGKWRDNLLPLAFMLGYVLVLVMSAFAQSERFHQPAMPFELMFAAYGLSIVVTKPKYKRWFIYWCGMMFIAAIVWNWFKLAGRGLA